MTKRPNVFSPQRKERFFWFEEFSLEKHLKCEKRNHVLSTMCKFRGKKETVSVTVHAQEAADSGWDALKHCICAPSISSFIFRNSATRVLVDEIRSLYACWVIGRLEITFPLYYHLHTSHSSPIYVPFGHAEGSALRPSTPWIGGSLKLQRTWR